VEAAMIIDLIRTTSSKIASALLTARRNAGSPAMGMVGTIVVVADEASVHDAMKATNEAGREHPSRVLVAVLRPGRAEPRVDAEIRVGEGVPGESVLLRLHGELAKVPESVVSPLLLPDSPVIVWWPGGGPQVPAKDPLGALGRRRITDAAATRRAALDFAARAEGYQPGDTDFAWTRLTPWRALLAAALDQYPTRVMGAEVVSVKGNPSADLLAAWLQCRLGVAVEQKTSRGPGITAVRMYTPGGPIAVTRPDGAVATFSIPGQPDRPVALKRRDTADLLSEELRRLDPDEVYARTVECLVERQKMPAEDKTVSAADRQSNQDAAQKAAARTTRVEKAASPALQAKAEGTSAEAMGTTAEAEDRTAETLSAAKKPTAAAKSARKSVAEKTAPAAAKKTTVKTTAKKAAAKKTAAKKSAVKKSAAKKTTAATKRTTAKKSASKRGAGQS